MERLLRWILDIILRQPLLFWTCMIANLLGAVIGGLWWYGPMLWESPLWALPFIPDCPLAALVGSIALLGLRAGKRWSFFYALVAFACMKYGIWTISFWLRQWSITGQAFPIEVLMVVTHIGLFIEGLLFVPRIGPLSFPKRLAVIGWFALSIFVDYGLGYYPPLASHVTPTFAFWLAIVLTALLGVGLLLLPRSAPRTAVQPAAA